MFLAAGIVACAIVPAIGHAQQAIVEQADSALGIAPFRYLSFGQTINLKPDRRIVLSYLQSCMRETITGGVVTIGAEISEIEGGTVDRTKAPCTSSALRLSENQGQQSVVMVLRSVKGTVTARSLLADKEITVRIVLFGTSPVIEVPGGGTVKFERLDAPGETLSFDVPRRPNRTPSQFDLAKSAQSLIAGAFYRVTVGASSHIVGIHDTARPGEIPIVERLLRLPPA